MYQSIFSWRPYVKDLGPDWQGIQDGLGWAYFHGPTGCILNACAENAARWDGDDDSWRTVWYLLIPGAKWSQRIHSYEQLNTVLSTVRTTDEERDAG